MLDISVVVLTYCSDYEKLIATLNSILIQVDVRFEIIVSDDGSENDYRNKLEKWFRVKRFSNYILNRSDSNNGTIQNYYRALTLASGKYVMGMGPGDFLFDEYVLHDVYHYCISNNVLCGFGNAVYYIQTNSGYRFVRQYAPKHPYSYCSENIDLQKVSLFFDSLINGTCYFRERLFAQQYFERLLSFAKFTEDSTCTILALSDGIKIQFFDRDVTWYETNSGISTIKDSSFSSILSGEIRKAFEYAQLEHPEDRIIKCRTILLDKSNKISKFLFLLHHPKLLFQIIRIKLSKKRVITDFSEYQYLLDKTVAVFFNEVN